MASRAAWAGQLGDRWGTAHLYGTDTYSDVIVELRCAVEVEVEVEDRGGPAAQQPGLMGASVGAAGSGDRGQEDAQSCADLGRHVAKRARVGGPDGHAVPSGSGQGDQGGGWGAPGTVPGAQEAGPSPSGRAAAPGVGEEQASGCRISAHSAVLALSPVWHARLSGSDFEPLPLEGHRKARLPWPRGGKGGCPPRAATKLASMPWADVERLTHPRAQVLAVPVEAGEVGTAEALLRFMYTGQLLAGVAATPTQLLLLFRLADRFQVGGQGLRCMGGVSPMLSHATQSMAPSLSKGWTLRLGQCCITRGWACGAWRLGMPWCATVG